MARIDIGALSLNIEDRGEGPAFIFIPGLVGLLEAWAFQMAEFSTRYRCIAFDHRGAGDSDKPRDAYTTELIAQDVIALMDTLGIDKAHVAGTSTGGCVLQNLAIDASSHSIIGGLHVSECGIVRVLDFCGSSNAARYNPCRLPTQKRVIDGKAEPLRILRRCIIVPGAPGVSRFGKTRVPCWNS